MASPSHSITLPRFWKQAHRSNLQWNRQATAPSTSGSGVYCPHHQHPCGLPLRSHSHSMPTPLRLSKRGSAPRAACTPAFALPPTHLYNLAEAAASTPDAASSAEFLKYNATACKKLQRAQIQRTSAI
eukprot:1152809-Pelagomonas_calceolata.AAC.1